MITFNPKVPYILNALKIYWSTTEVLLLCKYLLLRKSFRTIHHVGKMEQMNVSKPFLLSLLFICLWIKHLYIYLKKDLIRPPWENSDPEDLKKVRYIFVFLWFNFQIILFVKMMLALSVLCFHMTLFDDKEEWKCEWIDLAVLFWKYVYCRLLWRYWSWHFNYLLIIIIFPD